MTTPLDREKKYLRISAVGNIVIAIVGIGAAVMSASQAILLDGFFNLTYFATALFTIKVAGYVAGGDDARFPHGYSFFEPLVNGVKGMLVLGVSVMALAGAVQALLTGGREIAAGPAIAYGLFATVVCWIIAAITRRGSKETRSPLVDADAENWIVNAAVSSCVLLAFAAILLLRGIGLDSWTRYVDPLIVLTIILVLISVPVRMSWNALMALLNRAPPDAVVDEVTSIVDACLAELPVRERFVRVVQPGRQRWVMVHVVLPASDTKEVTELDTMREATFRALAKSHPTIFVDMIFTTNRKWGAPISDGGWVEPSASRAE